MQLLLDQINTSVLKLADIENSSDLCRMILEEIIYLTKIKSGIIFIKEDGKLEAAYSSKAPVNIKINKLDYIHRAFEKDKLVVINENNYSKFNFLKNATYKNVFCLSLIFGTEIIGIIVLFANRNIKLADSEISLLKLYSNIASIVIKKTDLNMQVQSTLALRDQFISLASHELRTPLTSINGYIQLLQRKLGGSNLPESRWIAELSEESGRLTRLIKELLDINRIKQGQLEFILHEVVAADVIEESISRFNFIYSDHNVFFQNELKNKQEKIIGDKKKLLQMVSAILNNAAKFSKPGSRIDITLCSNNRYISIKVKDSGIGIPRNEIDKIFKGFYKLGKGEEQGMGVGLLLAEHIIRHHRGKIEITSRKNHGTTIEVQLPRVPTN